MINTVSLEGSYNLPVTHPKFEHLDLTEDLPSPVVYTYVIALYMTAFALHSHV